MGYTLVQRGVAEFIATFTLIFVGAGSIVASQQILGTDPGAGGVGLITIAFAHGLAIATMVSAIGHVSGGHINPAVTIASLVTRNIDPPAAGIYIGSQLAGGIAGAALLRVAMPEDLWEPVALGATLIGDGISAGQAITIEAVLTFFLVFVIFGSAVDPEGAFQRIAGLSIGFAVLMGVLMGGPFTGASMNPARTLGPALIAGVWENWWVYLVATVFGGVAAGFVYDGVILKPRIGDHTKAA